MIKLIFLCRRRPDITRAQYTAFVLDGHAPLALKHHPTLQRYVINIAEGTPEGGPELDSLPALYFASLEDFNERLYDSPQGREIIRRDVERFMAGGADTYATTERLHIRSELPHAPLGQRSPGVKWMCLLKRRAGLTHKAFVDHWLDVHVPLVMKQQPRVARYVTSSVDARLSETGESWDGIAEIHFASELDARETLGDPPGAEAALAADRARFLDRHLVYPVAEYVEK
jgi:uncharacterized protein (TIGR02118 family)